MKQLEETGAASLVSSANQKRAQRRPPAASESRSDPAVVALGRVLGSLCVLTTRKGDLSGAMVASWVSQASFSPPGITVAVAKDRAVEALLHKGDRFALNVLAEGRETSLMKQFLQPFEPGADRFSGLALQDSPARRPCCQMLADRWRGETADGMRRSLASYAQVNHGGLFDAGSTAVRQRRSGADTRLLTDTHAGNVS